MTIKVRHERPDQRRYHRVTAPLFVRHAEGPVVRARDWSLGGLRVDDYPLPLPAVGEEIELACSLPFQGFDISFTVKGKVLRNVEEIRSFAIEFTEIGERERALMQHFIEDLVRGVMSGAEDTIQRIDVPLTPVSTEPDKDNKNIVQQRSIPLRQVAWISVYAALGFIVFGYMALVIYSNIFRMEVQTAVVSAPLVEVHAQGDGELSYIRASVGDRVAKGETVIYFADYDLEKQIDMAKVDIQRKEAALNNALQKRNAELARLNEYASVNLTNIEQVKTEVEEAEKQVQLAQGRSKRFRTLLDKGLATRNQLDDAEQFLIAQRARLKTKRVELQEQIRLADATIGKRYYNGREIVGDIDDADAATSLARYEVALSNQSHEALLKHRERLAIHAPFDGRLAELPVPEHASVKRGETIAVFEQDSHRRILAYLTQDEVAKIGLGDSASIYFPSLDISIRARVVDIDRTDGFREEVSRRYSWRSPDDRSAQVTLAFEESEDNAVKAQATPGLPAVVLFEAHSTNPVLAAMWRKVAALLL